MDLIVYLYVILTGKRKQNAHPNKHIAHPRCVCFCIVLEINIDLHQLVSLKHLLNYYSTNEFNDIVAVLFVEKVVMYIVLRVRDVVAAVVVCSFQ